MGVAIRCILEQDVPGVPWMEGKSLAMAYFGDSGSEGGGDTGTNADIIAVDFGGGKPQTPHQRRRLLQSRCLHRLVRSSWVMAVFDGTTPRKGWWRFGAFSESCAEVRLRLPPILVFPVLVTMTRRS
jgi:hypothetical protein